MKKIKWILPIVAIVVLLSGCSGSGKLESISYQEYQKLIENKESFVLEMMSTDCTHCKSLKPKLQKVVKEYGITVKVINLKNFSEEDKNEFTRIVGTQATPTIIFYKNGEETSVATRIVGDVTTDKIIQKFRENGIIQD